MHGWETRCKWPLPRILSCVPPRTRRVRTEAVSNLSSAGIRANYALSEAPGFTGFVLSREGERFFEA